jgi:hypothetical protein
MLKQMLKQPLSKSRSKFVPVTVTITITVTIEREIPQNALKARLPSPSIPKLISMPETSAK